jgi:hypothetical protein
MEITLSPEVWLAPASRPMPRSSVNQKQMHSPVLAYQRSIKALVSLKLTPREAEVIFWISQAKAITISASFSARRPAPFANTSSTFWASSTLKTGRPLQWWRSKPVARTRRRLKAALVSLGLQLPVLLRRSSVRYARIVPNFTANSRVWLAELGWSDERIYNLPFSLRAAA